MSEDAFVSLRAALLVELVPPALVPGLALDVEIEVGLGAPSVVLPVVGVDALTLFVIELREGAEVGLVELLEELPVLRHVVQQGHSKLVLAVRK